MNRLKADTELMALVPDGVYYDLATPNAKRYVIVSLIDPVDHSTFGARALEDNVYLVKSVGLSVNMTVPQSNAAADRIDDVLDGVELTVSGFAHVDCRRDEDNARIRIARRDAVDTSLIWYESGGFYRVRASLPGA